MKESFISNRYFLGKLKVIFIYSILSFLVNNPFTKFESPFGSNFIVRIDKANGKTIWAKEILFNPNGIYFLIIKTLIVNDIAWSLFIYASKGINAPGIIIKIKLKIHYNCNKN